MAVKRSVLKTRNVGTCWRIQFKQSMQAKSQTSKSNSTNYNDRSALGDIR